MLGLLLLLLLLIARLLLPSLLLLPQGRWRLPPECYALGVVQCLLAMSEPPGVDAPQRTLGQGLLLIDQLTDSGFLKTASHAVTIM
mmetsp:Transcript_58678/g.105052  ORF Transcript_58678/g.105052 Transcript_58678/m.105052 type:complete len:86 (-) Transcript_58678:87-344(-)